MFLILREFWGSEIAAKEILVQVHTYALNDSDKWARFSELVLMLGIIKKMEILTQMRTLFCISSLLR